MTGEPIEGGWVGSLVDRLAAVDLPIPKARPARQAPLVLAMDEALAPPKAPAKPALVGREHYRTLERTWPIPKTTITFPNSS